MDGNDMTDIPRLIEHAFPLKQTSLDSVHEKNVRHGHISTLHIWPARRPLAACRAALIATLLPDPSTKPKPEGMSDDEWHKEIVRQRQALCEKVGGKVVKKIEKKKMPNGQIVEREKEVTEGGILHWGRETENKDALDWFRQEIRNAYDGRPPKVLDPFAGGGAIPLEAMRLGCEATAVDINPVAWFILKCTLEYPQKLAGKAHPLPDFILADEDFMEAFYKAHSHLVGRTKKTNKQIEKEKKQPGFWDKPDSGRSPKADLAWHVRAWGRWVLDHARQELARFYPTYADFEPLDKIIPKPYEKKPMRLVPLQEDGTPNIDALNAEFSREYLNDKRNPRWVAKPTIAYLWARKVTCKNCRAVVPLLKTRWLCKKDKKRVLLTMRVVEQTVEQTMAGKVMVGQAMVGQAMVGQASVPVINNNQKPFKIYQRKLPHWRLQGATYFLTWRLHKSQAGLKPEERELVVSAIRHFEGSRYRLLAYVVMDDHVHVLFEVLAGYNLSEITHSWKSFTANQLQRQHERKGVVWQDESFDRIVRDDSEFIEKAEYIQNNPRKRWPDITEYTWLGFPQWQQEVTGRGVCPEMTGRDACPTKNKVVFGVETNVPIKGGNAAQRREHDKRIGAGTMSRSGAKCPCCGAIMTMEDIRLEGQSGRLGAVNTAVVVDGRHGKEYRLPTEGELFMTGTEACPTIEKEIKRVFAQIPFGLPEEPTPKSGSGASRAFSVDGYGFDQWGKLFTPRQLLSLGTFVKWTRSANEELTKQKYPSEWRKGVTGCLAVQIDKVADYNSMVCVWHISGEKIGHTFTRFALPITWDFTELAVTNDVGGAYSAQLDWLSRFVEHALGTGTNTERPVVQNQSAIVAMEGNYDAVVTDPPYYDAIPYSDLMDFFYVWLRRTLSGLSSELESAFKEPLSPKWDHDKNDGELIDDASRHGGDKAKSKAIYEDGMARVFQACNNVLKPEGKLVVVFANKQPDAWETLVSALIRAGFVVNGSWPIQTEMSTRMRAKSSAALASSVWLVCKKRPATARPGWDNQVLEDMRRNIRERLREFWDAGIRGPDFVWAATGPAMEAFSKHPVVRKANEAGPMTVSEFLTHVRRMVVDFVVGRVLSGDGGEMPGTEAWPTDRLDEPTAYYLLHRHDFGMDEAAAGACILYAISCGISDKELAGTWNLIGFTKGKSVEDNGEVQDNADAGIDPDADAESGSKVKLKTWVQRKGRSLGFEAPGGRPIPLIDRVHCLMHLWKSGDLYKVDEYLDDNALRRQELFKRLLQSLIELSPAGSEERSLLESLSNHIQSRGAVNDRQMNLALQVNTE